MNYSVILQKFENFYIPRQNITLLRSKSLTYKQKEGQSFDEFMNQLKTLSSNCKFEDIVVIGVIDDSLRERILRKPNLNLESNAIRTVDEQTKIHARELKQEAEIYRINFNKKKNSNSFTR